MNIQQKILNFRKDKLMLGKPVTGLVYRVNKDEAIEVAEFMRTLDRQLSTNCCPESAIYMANEGIFKPLHELILHMGTFFGIEIHPDWQEYTNKNTYY